MLAAIFLPDALRYTVAVMVGFDLLLMPRAVVWQTRRLTRMGVLYLLAIELLLVGAVNETFHRLHHRLVWWGSPLTLIAAAAVAVYVVLAWRARRREG